MFNTQPKSRNKQVCVSAVQQGHILHHSNIQSGLLSTSPTALKKGAVTKHDGLWCFHPFSGSQKKTTLTDPGDIDVCAWHFSYHWQRWECERPVGCIYKTPLMSGVPGWKARRRYSGCGEMKPSQVQPCTTGTVICRPVKQACSAHARRRQLGRCVRWVIQLFHILQCTISSSI